MKFVFDENFSPAIVSGLSTIDAGAKNATIKADIISSFVLVGPSKADEDIIEAASHMDAIIITHDRDFKNIKRYRAKMKAHKVGFILFRVPPRRYEYWDIACAVISHWEEIKSNFPLSDEGHPIAFEVNKTGQLQRLYF